MRRLLVLLLLALAIAPAACSDESPRPYRAAAAVVLAAGTGLDLPLRDSGPHWLLRDQSGWCGAYAAQFGGDDQDPAVATVRAAVFRNGIDAAHAYERLTPAYLGRALELRVLGTPWPVTYPVPLSGDQSTVMGYQVRLPIEEGPDVHVEGQFTGIRAGHVVLLVESIGIPPEQFVPAVARWVEAAAAFTLTGC